ncbi:MAG: hypothetical protein H0U57_15070 [Tatlockia sp.]|nr:hypothetical protein [Tatlockia sp.]
MNRLLLLEKINLLTDINSRKIFLNFYKQEDFNTMFRQTAVKPENLDIAGFLYTHKEEFKIDVNAKGKSNKTALDFAIERDAKENVLFLLKLEEIEVNDLTRDKIFDKFGNNFRTVNVSTNYVALGDKLISMNSRVKQSTLDYQKNLSSLVNDLKDKVMTNFELVKSQGSKEEFSSIRQSLLLDMKNFVDNFLLELSKLNEFEDFEELFNQYLPYSYAQEKLLNGNEYAKSNLNSSMKNTCLHNRKYLQETALGVHHNKLALISNFDEVMQLFILNLVLFDQKITESTYIIVKDEDQGDDPNLNISKPEPSEPSEPSSENHPSLNLEKSVDFSNFTNHSKKSNRNKNSNNSFKEPNLNKSNAKLENLKYLCDEINQLKQKGQVKLSAFQALIKDLSKEIDLQIKTTKKGFMVSQSTNHFSFHRPHEDKGIDKAALQSLKNIVEENIQGITNSSCKF